MRLSNAAGTVIMRDRVQWTRCAFDNVALQDAILTLAPDDVDETAGDDTPFTGGFAGLAFDRHCRLFHPNGAAIDYALWGSQTALRVQQDSAHPFVFTNGDDNAGGFGTAAPLPQTVQALACDEADYLYAADPDTPALWLIDIWQHEVARQVDTAGRPRDLCYRGGSVYVLLDTPGWLRVTPCDPPLSLAWPAELGAADRLEVGADGQAFVLIAAGSAGAEVVSLMDTTLRLALPFCTDFLIVDEGEQGARFVLARRPGEQFAQRRLIIRHFSPLAALQAPQYDGRGIALAPDGRIAYWTARGLRHAAPGRPRYREQGFVTGFALDSDIDQNEWGTMVFEACIPEGTQVRVYCITRDDLDYGDPLPRTAPAGETLTVIPLPLATPLPSLLDWAHASGAGQALFGDPSLRPLAPPIEDGFVRYEAPVIAAPGRFLWLIIALKGTRSRSPRVRSARVEYPVHQLVRQLPRTLWREPAARDFLTRLLAPAAAMLAEWGQVSDGRHRLLDPRSAPAGALDWIGSLVGLSMDSCWSEQARRRMLAEIAQLYRSRGTLDSLRRMIAILTGGQVVIIEKFRLRGGGVIGNAEATSASSVLGGGFRVGGSIGDTGAAAPGPADAFDAYAHRFSVTIVASLGAEQLACVRRLVETHKPAHTGFDLCTIATGVRVGVGLHVGISSAIGRSSGFDPLILGDAVLGKGYVLGRPGLAP